MSTYLKHMGGYTYKQLKGKSFDEIQKLFNKEMKRVNTFVARGSEVHERKEKKVEGSEETAKSSRKKMLERKRAGKEQQQEFLKRQKVEKEKESDKVEEVDEVDKAELKKPLLLKEGMMIHYQLIREDRSSKRYSSMIRMLQGIDREDLEALWRIVKAKYGDTRLKNEFERVLWGDLKVMFELDKRSDVWRILQGYRVTIWKLVDSSGVHFVRFDNVYIFMLVEKRYPLTPITITNMLGTDIQEKNEKKAKNKQIRARSGKCMRTRSKARRLRQQQQQQVPSEFCRTPKDYDGDNRTMAELLRLPPRDTKDAIVVPKIGSSNI
ncbi:hypothetical protein Tco_0178323 [Tanacetum coccineum]